MTASSLSYDDILISKLPHPIRNEGDADRIREEIRVLVHTFPRTEGEEEYLSLLGDLLISWETGRYETPAVSGIEALRCMLEDNDMKQAELVGPVFASPGIASEILSGKRKLTLNHVRKLAAFFHTSPALFIS